MSTSPSIDSVRDLLLRCLQEADPPPPGSVDADTLLLGKSSHFDSLGLVNYIVDVEQALDEQLGVAVTLADERAMSQTRSPFRTVQSLTDYIMTLTTPDDGAGSP